MFSLICAWINRWVNNRQAGDLRCHRTHYDVNVMSHWAICRKSFFSHKHSLALGHRLYIYICSLAMASVSDRYQLNITEVRAQNTDYHYNDVIMGTMASQITSLTIVYSTVYSGADQRKHQSSVPLAFVRGIHRCPVNSPHKWPVMWKMFRFDEVIMIQIKLWDVITKPCSNFNMGLAKPGLTWINLDG